MYIDDREKTSKEIVKNIEDRSKIENNIRNLLLNDGYTEVRTPIINRYADIAPGKQFIVNSPLETMELYLRIAPTEQLKKLMAMGFDKVFEFSTNFRNDKIDKTHLFEFTSLEIMDKNKSVYDKMNQTEQIIKNCIEFCLNNRITDGSNDFCKAMDYSWNRFNVIEYFFENYGVDISREDCIEELKNIYSQIFGKKCNLKSNSEIISEIMESVVINYNYPVFFGGFPWYMEGPAKKSDAFNGKERFELYYKDLEIANMSSTLVDKKSLLDWYHDGITRKNTVEHKNYDLDPDLLNIFVNKMPNSAVVGIGIDRLIMLLLNREKVSDIVCFDNKRVNKKIKKL